MDLLYAILGFTVTVGILVTVHEFGHFWVARRLGVKVLRFSIGFGKPLWTRQSGPDATEYVISAIPLGGYVKMLDEREGKVAEKELPRAFNRQPLSVRLAIVLAGPLFNLLFAVFAYWLMFMTGINGIKPFVMDVAPESVAARASVAPNDTILSVDGRRVGSWETVIQAIVEKSFTDKLVPIVVRGEDGIDAQLSLNLSSITLDDLAGDKFFHTIGAYPPSPLRSTVIGRVQPGGAARRAGLSDGDRVIAAEGETFSDWSAWRRFIQRHPGKTLEVHIERDGLPMTVTMRPDPVKTEAGTIGFIGAVADRPTRQSLEDYRREFYITERYSPFSAFGHALTETTNASLLTVRMLWKILTLNASVKNLSGPITIAQYAGTAVQIGVAKFLQLLAILSVSIGILNLLPIPMLDGGHIMYYCIEFVKGKPLTEKAQFAAQQVGITMLIGLMGLVLFNDLARLFG
uniref:Zinc metalloprotease n=1 Tax=Candidatus Kentrum eta TaxID=2126337 RepID=A0A450UIA9_9GAMM|nr:MAG: regulator of sigma E protease [Candidatus Kentron sp. H]VFJ92237.1 MAG: regulator of sigma E protease [Candidatus Kentron sp. H]VFJ98908.1 MAG: regulator of sigma E protease [Candidatus Kentron sp. H]